MRLLAILLVLGRHMYEPAPWWPGWLQAGIDTLIRGGWIGVDLFFVLSGFLVSGLLFAEFKKKGGVSLRRFYIRRGLKIYPPFVVLIAVTLLLNPMTGRANPPERIAAEFLFVQNYFPSLWGHHWSLAVEEHFYLLLPGLLVGVLWWRGRRGAKSPAVQGGGDAEPTQDRPRASATEPLRPVFYVALGVCVFCLLGRLIHAQINPAYHYRTHLFPTHLRMDGLMFGVVLSYLYHFRSAWYERVLVSRRRLLIGVGALLLVPPFVFTLETTPWIYTVGLSVISLGSGALVVGLLGCKLPAGRWWLRWPASVGAHSYSIYLWHGAALVWVVPRFESLAGGQFPREVRYLVYFGSALVLGVGMAKLVEWPVLRLRDRWFPRDSSGPVVGRITPDPAKPNPAKSNPARRAA